MTKKNSTKKKDKRIPKSAKKSPKMPPKEPKWHENEPNDPLKRPKMLKEHFFCPRSHILGRMTKTHQPRKKPKTNPKYANKSPKMPRKEPKWHANEPNIPETQKYHFFCSSSHITEPMTKNNSKEPKLHQGSRCVYIYPPPPHTTPPPCLMTNERSE
jgi:hypothetical protein